jgi:predicted MFS family arabinose efflux permease
MAFAGAIGGSMGERHGWRAPFIVLGAVGLVYAVVLAKGLRREEPVGVEARRDSSSLGASLSAVLRLPGYSSMLTAFTAFAIANWIVYTWLPLYMFEQFHLSLAAAGFSATFYLQVASFGGILAGGWLADRWSRSSPKGRALTQALGAAVAAPFLFLVGVTGSVPVLVAALIAFGLGKGFYDASTMPVLAQVAPHAVRATGYGIFNMAGCVVGGVMAAAAGALKPLIGLAGAIQISALLLLAATLSLLAVGRVLKDRAQTT